MTRRGSACSVVIGEGLPLGGPGSGKGVQLVVEDLDAAREQLFAVASPSATCSSSDLRVPRAAFAFFTDPDGNTWALQELKRDSRR